MDLFGIYRICLRIDRTLLSIRNGFTTLRTLCLRTFSYGRVIIAGIIGALAPSSLIIRILALIVGLFSAIKGLMISIRHLDLQMNPAPWKQCEFIPNFPETLPFHKWLPAVFNPTGSCNESQWSLFGITMVQWLVFIFAVYVLVLGLITISQVKKSRRRRLIFK